MAALPLAPARYVVAVSSGKGGVGKSTVALNVALALAEGGQAVGILDADLYGPDIPRMLDLKRKDSAPATHWTMASTKKTAIEPVEAYGLQVVSAGFIVTEDQPFAPPSGLLHRLLWQFAYETRWGDLDVLLVDLPPGTADLQQGLTQAVPLSGTVVVVTPQDVAHLDARKIVTQFRQRGVQILGGVENMSGLLCPHCKERIDIFPRVREERSIWAMGVGHLGEIPMEPAVAHSGDSGTPLLVEEPGSASAHAFRDVASALMRALTTPSRA